MAVAESVTLHLALQSTLQSQDMAQSTEKAPRTVQKIKPQQTAKSETVASRSIAANEQAAVQPSDVESSASLPVPESVTASATDAMVPSTASIVAEMTQPASPQIVVAKVEALRLNLQQRLARVYPLMAKQRGWQGGVLLGFQVSTQGAIHDIQVLQSSGYTLLDKSAMKSLSELDLLAFAGAIPANLQMDLAVSYRLYDL